MSKLNFEPRIADKELVANKNLSQLKLFIFKGNTFKCFNCSISYLVRGRWIKQYSIESALGAILQFCTCNFAKLQFYEITHFP